jgi:hypothetical protein
MVTGWDRQGSLRLHVPLPSQNCNFGENDLRFTFYDDGSLKYVVLAVPYSLIVAPF